MRNVPVRYTVKADRAGENESLVRAVFDDLELTGPEGLREATFRQDDGVSFVHIASIAGDYNPLSESAAFKAFQTQIGDRCEVPPVAIDLHEVGSYRFFEA